MSNVIYTDSRINITGSNKGMKKKTGRQRYTDRKLVVWALAGEASALPLSMDLNREAGYCIPAEQEIKVITYR